MITRLLQLLVPLMVVTYLVALIPLIAVSGLIALKSSTGAAASVTRPMENTS